MESGKETSGGASRFFSLLFYCMVAIFAATATWATTMFFGVLLLRSFVPELGPRVIFSVLLFVATFAAVHVGKYLVPRENHRVVSILLLICGVAFFNELLPGFLGGYPALSGRLAALLPMGLGGALAVLFAFAGTQQRDPKRDVQLEKEYKSNDDELVP